MKKDAVHLKLCNNPFKEKAEKFQKRAIGISITVAMLVAVIVLIIVDSI